MVSAKSRGSLRERQVAEIRREQGWVVMKAGGSLGPADLFAARSGVCSSSLTAVHAVVELIQVKSDRRSPWDHMGPQERFELLVLAALAGGTAVVAWWPPRGELRWLYPDEWPEARRVA